MPRPRRSQDTRERLLDEGVQALRARGFHGTGLKALVERVRVPKGSFYNYFASKEDFGSAVIRRYGASVVGRLDAAIAAAGDDPLAALAAHFDDAIAAFDAAGAHSGCLLCNLAAEIGGERGPCAQALCETLATVHERLERLIRAAQAHGQLRDDVDAPALAHALQDAWNGALIRMQAERSVRPLEQFRALHLGVLLVR